MTSRIDRLPLIRTALAVAVVALVQPAAALQVDGEERTRAIAVDPQREAAVAAVLLQQDQELQQLETQLVELGPDHLPALFSVLIDGRVTVYEEGRPQTVQLPARLAGPVRGALAHVPMSRTRAFLGNLARKQPSLPEQNAALDLLSRLGSGEDLVLLVRLGEPPRDQERVSRDVRRAFEQALTRLLARDPITAQYLAEAFLEAHPSFASTLIRAFGDVDPGRGLELLASVLGRSPEVDTLVLAEIGNAGAQLVPPVDADLRASVRGFLNSSRPELVVEAAVVAGKLKDTQAVPDLIPLLRDPLPATRAAEALRAITGQRFRGPDSWEAWYKAELTWWRGPGGGQLERLRTSDPAEVAQILMNVSRKRLYRDEISLAVTDVLSREERDLVLMACSVLGHLGSGLAVAELVTALQHTLPEVQSAARKALVQITGRDHENDLEAWRAEIP